MGVGNESQIHTYGSPQYGSQTHIDWSVIVPDRSVSLACEDNGRAQAVVEISKVGTPSCERKSRVCVCVCVCV